VTSFLVVPCRGVSSDWLMSLHLYLLLFRTLKFVFNMRLFPEMEEILIEKVRQRTFLYDTKSPDYRDQYLRANAL
jgi:hypothetical protein